MATLTEVIKRRPDFAMVLFASFFERLRQSDEVIEKISARLATLPLDLGDRFGAQNGAGTMLDERLTRQDLANMSASTREAVSKVMSGFQREGTIEIQNRRIVIRDRDTLVEHAAGPSGLGYA